MNEVSPVSATGTEWTLDHLCTRIYPWMLFVAPSTSSRSETPESS